MFAPYSSLRMLNAVLVIGGNSVILIYKVLPDNTRVYYMYCKDGKPTFSTSKRYAYRHEKKVINEILGQLRQLLPEVLLGTMSVAD
jgi:hypothetical protein